ncbi:MAG TPA: sensor histidine kinase [Chitinophagaceae bacterium]|nr:sensor histidine kinase [Chitinophagaceae bacterium]
MKSGYLFLILLFISCNLAVVTYSFGQPDQTQTSFGYSVAKQRLQLKLTTSFVYFNMQGQLDMDSSAIMVSEGEHLPYSLYYDEDYVNGTDNNVKELLKKGSYYLFKSGSNKNDLDAALHFLLSAKLEADKTKDTYFQNAALAALGRYYLQSNDAAKSKNCFREAVELARRANDPVILFRALANRGSNAGFNDDQKEKDLNESLALSRQLRDTVGEIEMLTRIYEIHFVQQKFDTVKKQLLHVTELENLIGYKHTHYNYYVLSYLDFVASDYVNVFSKAKAAIEIMEANRDFAFSNFFYGNMANIYARFDNYEKALEWLNKSLEQEPANKAKRVWYHQFCGVTLNIAKFGHPKLALDAVLNTIRDYPPMSGDNKFHIANVLGYSYYSMHQRDSCEKYYRIMLFFIDSTLHDYTDNDKLFSAYLDVANFYMDIGRPDLTKKYFEKGKPYGDTSNIFPISKIHHVQYRIDSSEGNYLKALNEYKLSRMADDNIYNLRKTNQFTELQIEHETATKDKNIELLKQKDKAQQATLRQSNFMKKVTLAGIVVMLIVTVLIYTQYRNKQRSNKMINEKNLTLEQLVKEKEWLVKEIHHRVKNNFHIVASLLEIQSSYLKNKEALSAIKESQHRIHSMSIIHQKLYQSETMSTIHMPEYIYELVEYLRESYAIRENIGFSLQIENIELNHASAITLGLILNEAITNAIKYAFAKVEDGKISISLTHISDSQILLSIADNGRGLPADFDSKIGASMGMELLQGLTDDLGGSFSIEAHDGTHIKVIFDYKPMTAAHASFS